MTRRLLKRRGWRAPTGAQLDAELDHVSRESRATFDKPLAALSADELTALSQDIMVRAESAADLCRILAANRGRS